MRRGSRPYLNVPFIQLDLTKSDVGRSGESVELFLLTQSNSFTEIGFGLKEIALNESLETSYISCSCSQTVATLQDLETRCEDLLYDGLKGVKIKFN